LSNTSAHAELLLLVDFFILIVSTVADKLVDIFILFGLLRDVLKLSSGFLLFCPQSFNVDDSWSSHFGSALPGVVGDYDFAKVMLRL